MGIKVDRTRWLGTLLVLGGASTCALPAISAHAAGQQTPSAARAPQAIYERTCGYCHGSNVGPIILGRKLPPQTIEYFVRHGRGAMPAFKPTEITDHELAALARWISETPANPQERGQ